MKSTACAALLALAHTAAVAALPLEAQFRQLQAANTKCAVTSLFTNCMTDFTKMSSMGGAKSDPGAQAAAMQAMCQTPCATWVKANCAGGVQPMSAMDQFKMGLAMGGMGGMPGPVMMDGGGMSAPPTAVFGRRMQKQGGGDMVAGIAKLVGVFTTMCKVGPGGCAGQFGQACTTKCLWAAPCIFSGLDDSADAKMECTPRMKLAMNKKGAKGGSCARCANYAMCYMDPKIAQKLDAADNSKFGNNVAPAVNTGSTDMTQGCMATPQCKRAMASGKCQGQADAGKAECAPCAAICAKEAAGGNPTSVHIGDVDAKDTTPPECKPMLRACFTDAACMVVAQGMSNPGGIPKCTANAKCGKFLTCMMMNDNGNGGMGNGGNGGSNDGGGDMPAQCKGGIMACMSNAVCAKIMDDGKDTKMFKAPPGCTANVLCNTAFACVVSAGASSATPSSS